MRTLVVLLLATAACVGDEGDSINDRSSSIVVDNKLSANKLSANKLSANKLSANKLSANKLSANRLELNKAGAAELLATPEGREVLSFIVSCAIADGQTLVAEFEGTTYEFFGEVGLANHWLNHRLDDQGAGWVSACLFSRVNANNVSVPISLRGDHRALSVTPDEAANWSLQEGAFYGDYFTPANEPINWIACRGADQAAGETGGLVERDCAEPDPAHPGLTLCGFKFAGECGDFADTYACRRFDDDGTFYERCHDDDIYGAKHHKHGPHHGKVYRQVITTYVIP